MGVLNLLGALVKKIPIWKIFYCSKHFFLVELTKRGKICYNFCKFHCFSLLSSNAGSVSEIIIANL